MSPVIHTYRLLLRPWTETDAADALEIFGHEAAEAMLPAGIRTVEDETAMLSALRLWRSEDHASPPVGHWAVEEKARHRLVGGCALALGAPGPESLKLQFGLHPSERGHGYATEAGNALIQWAMHECGVYEVFAVVQPDNPRGHATVLRMGMEWVGEAGSYRGGRLQIYRIRHGDLAYEDSHTHADSPPEAGTTEGNADARRNGAAAQAIRGQG